LVNKTPGGGGKTKKSPALVKGGLFTQEPVIERVENNLHLDESQKGLRLKGRGVNGGHTP